MSRETTVSTEGIVCAGISPRLTEWLPELLADLRSHTERTVRHHVSAEDPWRASVEILSRTLPAWPTLDRPPSDDAAEAVAYTHAITALTRTYGNTAVDALSPYHHQRQTDLIDTVESVGTGRGPVNGGLGALAKGPVALHRELDEQPRVVTLLLDGPEWISLGDRRTGVRALAAIAVLADAFDVRIVASPGLRRELVKRYPRWTSVHLDLTASRERSHTEARHDDHPAWTALAGLESTPRKRQLLGSLTTARERTYRDLEQDHEVDIEAGTVSRYVLDLADRGLVTISRNGEYNTVRLTPLGETATERFLTAENELIHPDQRRLDGCLTATPHESTSTVSPRREGPPGAPSIDGCLAATGETETAAEYVQWLTGPEDVSASQLHRRFATVAHDDSVTLVDDHPHAFEDGRVAYLSHTTDETLVVLQWGGPLATLGRLAGALLSDIALSKILTPSRFGREFEAIHDSATDYDAPRLLRRGHQVGWYSDDEETYEAWRDRITTVRDRLLARLAKLTASDDTAARRKLFEDLHGLVASATHLYHAVGVDLTTTIRIPDTDALTRNTTRLQNLCEFLAKTVPKQSVYGIHSGYRMLFEDRPEKLRRRLPSQVEPDIQLDLTMSWVVAGPTATALQDAITTALQEELTTVREAIADGTEQAPTLEIPVVDGTTYPAIRRVIDEIAMIHDVQWTPHERQRLVRLCLRSFGPSDTTRRACPYDVVVSLLRALSESQHPPPATVERAAATLPATRFRPDLTPTATKLYATLLQADRPLGRTDLIDRAGISASSYDRRVSDIQALERVRAVQVEGRRRWTIDDATSQIPSISWWPAHVGATYPSTPLLALRDTNATGDIVVNNIMWSPRPQRVHRPVGALSPRSTATASHRIRDTSFPVNVLQRLKHQYMLQILIHQNLRLRVPDRQHRDGQFANQPSDYSMRDSPHWPTAVPTTQPNFQMKDRGEIQ
ncbi:plasmid replication protein RepH [Halorubrum tropicale]|uniref:plasmid replication protein RepH n=1 Tax=Halorubrum tropicale TaxID=1765655 RepID=UPI000ADDA77D|nr:plasmid replication protein RepH [Halorubrum tropicale]